MVIALFGREVSPENLKYVQRVVDKLILKKCRLTIADPGSASKSYLDEYESVEVQKFGAMGGGQ